MKHCIVLCLVFLAGSSAAWGQTADMGAGNRGIPSGGIGIGLPPDGPDDLCDDEDEIGDVVLGCEVTKVTTSLEGPVPSTTFWGTFCDGPTVFAGQTDGTLQPLLVLSASPSFLTVDLTGNDDPADVVFKIGCPCETCDYKLTLGAGGPTGPTGPADPAVLDALCELYGLTGHPLPEVCNGGAAPGGGVLTLIASPASVVIDVEAGETEGTTTLIAQALHASGLPVGEIPVFFTSTGGLLGSVHNVCDAAGQCTRSGGPCSNDDDCPVLPPEAVETNASGIATDSLTLRLIEDPDEVVVTAQALGATASTTVQKIVTGPANPVAVISATPSGGQLTGLPFLLDGSGSTFDPEVDGITCYDWSIVSSNAPFEPGDSCVPCSGAGCTAACSTRSAVDPIVVLTIGQQGNPDLDQDLTVTLRVSDDPSIVDECTDSGMPDDNKFSASVDTISYLIRCDLTDPMVDAGPDVFASLGGEGQVPVALSAVAFDPEDPDLDYVWNCGNGTGGTEQTVTCVYETAGVFAASVTVENDCGLTSEDSLVVTIVP
jgi:hypothetical protein